jgi:hypothetical protein
MGANQRQVTGTFPAVVDERGAVMSAATRNTPNLESLTILDRCDRCGAQAYLRIELAGGSELLFCAHHSRKHGQQFRSIAVSVHDETSKLGPRPPAVHC